MLYIYFFKHPPNFLIQANLQTYVTQEVVVPQEEEEPAEGNLIDMTDSASGGITERPPEIPEHISQTHLDLIAERDNLIKHLQKEIDKLR